MKKIVLDAGSLAQLASGVPLKDLEHAVEDADTGANAGADAGEGADAGAAAGADAGDSSDAGADAGNGADAGAASKEAGSDMVGFLKDELKEVRAELAEATMKLAKAESDLEQASADMQSMKEIALEATERLQVSLGQTPVDMSSMSAEAISQQYAVTKKAFLSRFKVGQTSASAEDADVVNIKATTIDWRKSNGFQEISPC